MINNFLEKSYTKCGGETSPRPFSWKLKFSISLDQQSKVLYSLLLLYGKLRAIEIYRNKATDYLLSPHIKLFQKIKRGLELVSLPHFPHNFWRKIFLLLYSINLPNFIVWLPLLCETLSNMCIAIVCKPGCDVMNFEVNLIFLIKPFFLHDQKVVTKTKISWERKEFWRWNKKHFSSFLKGFQSIK